MDRYNVLNRIGAGAHGVVSRARHRESGRIVALKKVGLRKLEDSLPLQALREIKALQFLKGEHIVQLLDLFAQGMGFVLVFEFMHSDLAEMIHDYRKPLKRAHVKSYMQMLLRGIEFMHQRRIVHRDLKPANLLIGEDGRLKIGDLGLSRVLEVDGEGRQSRPYSHQVATRWYRAPELLYGARFYTEAVDLWSVGCIFGEMLNFAPIFPGDNDIDQLGLVIRTLGTPTEQNWPGVKDLPDYSKITFPPSSGIEMSLVPSSSPGAQSLFSKFVLYDASRRIHASEALNHDYFTHEWPAPAALARMPKPDPGKSRINTHYNGINNQISNEDSHEDEHSESEVRSEEMDRREERELQAIIDGLKASL